MMGGKNVVLVGAAVVAASCWSATATLNRYDKEPLVNNYLIYRKNAMYSLEDAPSALSDARAEINVKLDFEFPASSLNNENELVQVSIFPLEDYQYIGATADASTDDEEAERFFCCTANLAAEGKLCDTPGKLIIDKKATKTVTYNVRPEADGVTRVNQVFQVKQTGFHYLVISYCSDEPSEVEISGTTRWINPYGYLPGEVYGFLPFYSYMSMAYLMCALVWAYLCSRQWRDLLPLQNWCTVVIGFGLVEVYLRYMDFYHFNTTGERSKSIMLGSVFFLCLKKTVSRLLVLTVCLGWGVLRPSLGEAANKIVILGSAYFGFSCIQLTVENLSHSHSLTFGGYLLVLPVICLDFVFFVWIFTSLNSIIGSLVERRQDTKLELYRSFRLVLIVCVSVGVLWSLVFTYCVLSNWADSHWESFWRLEGFWDLLYFGVLVMILTLWRPNSNSMRYAYDRVSTHDAEAYDDDLEDTVALKGRTSPE